MVFFTRAGFDEMDEVTGDGSAELLDDGSIEITFAYHNGDEAILKANVILLQKPASPPSSRRRPSAPCRLPAMKRLKPGTRPAP